METQFEQMRHIARTIAAAAPVGANSCMVQFANYFPEIGAPVLCVAQIIPAGNEHRGQTGRIALAVLDETRDVDEQFAALRREASPAPHSGSQTAI